MIGDERRRRRRNRLHQRHLVTLPLAKCSSNGPQLLLTTTDGWAVFPAGMLGMSWSNSLSLYLTAVVINQQICPPGDRQCLEMFFDCHN